MVICSQDGRDSVVGDRGDGEDVNRETGEGGWGGWWEGRCEGVGEVGGQIRAEAASSEEGGGNIGELKEVGCCGRVVDAGEEAE